VACKFVGETVDDLDGLKVRREKGYLTEVSVTFSDEFVLTVPCSVVSRDKARDTERVTRRGVVDTRLVSQNDALGFQRLNQGCYYLLGSQFLTVLHRECHEGHLSNSKEY
jgi:hypothetical protein